MKVRVPATMRGGLRALLGSLVLLLVLFPVLDEGLVGRGVLVIVSTVIGLSGAYAASRDRRWLATALLLAMPSLAARWAFVFVGTPAVRGAALVTSMRRCGVCAPACGRRAASSLPTRPGSSGGRAGSTSSGPFVSWRRVSSPG